jgi:hypothetical protein
MTGQQSAAPERSPHEASEALSTKLHGAELVLKGIDRLIMDGLERNQADRLFDLLEIVWQFVEVTSTYVKEAQDVAGELTAALSGAHP